MAVADANAAPSGSMRFDLVVRDTARGGFQDPHEDEATDPIFDDAHGAQDIELFGQQPRILGVIGPFESNVALAEIPIASRAHLALITASARDDRLTSSFAATTFFRMYPPDIADALAAARAVHQMGFSRLFAIDDGVRRERAEREAFVGALRKSSATIVGQASFGTDFALLLARIRTSGADAVIFFGPAPTNVLIMRSNLAAEVLAPSREQFMAEVGFMDPAFSPAAHEPDVDYYTIWPDPLPSTAATIAFETAFRKNYDEAPSNVAKAYYAAATTLIDSIEKASSVCSCVPTRSNVVDAVRGNGSSGSLAEHVGFSQSGDLRSWRMALVRIRNDKYVVVRDFTVSR
jgi:branched-chain amino acid transport system substrate-binding protein